ncbi:hypothetical protein FACS1894147_01960 [Spirochaetia bacterium]|nr:hypothetical protein FACS1894147_01960 [Spirochaetia bacterium]
MKRFNFSLEKLLEMRKFRERETEIELGRTMGILQNIEHRLKDLAIQLSSAADERFLPQNTLDVIQSYDAFISRLELTREDLLKEAAEAEAKVEEARLVYLEASRDRKVLDKLKERQQKEYKKLAAAAETKTLDDISGGVAARRMAAGD